MYTTVPTYAIHHQRTHQHAEVAKVGGGGRHVLQHGPALGRDAVPVAVHHGDDARDSEREPPQLVLGRERLGGHGAWWLSFFLGGGVLGVGVVWLGKGRISTWHLVSSGAPVPSSLRDKEARAYP